MLYELSACNDQDDNLFTIKDNILTRLVEFRDLLESEPADQTELENRNEYLKSNIFCEHNFS